MGVHNILPKTWKIIANGGRCSEIAVFKFLEIALGAIKLEIIWSVSVFRATIILEKIFGTNLRFHVK